MIKSFMISDLLANDKNHDNEDDDEVSRSPVRCPPSSSSASSSPSSDVLNDVGHHFESPSPSISRLETIDTIDCNNQQQMTFTGYRCPPSSCRLVEPDHNCFCCCNFNYVDCHHSGAGASTNHRHPPMAVAMTSPSASHDIWWQHYQHYQHFLNSRLLANTRPRRGGQIRFTAKQTVTLENRFDQRKYLSPGERKSIAIQLGLSERQIKTWFQNRRAKWRRAKNGSDNNQVDGNRFLNSDSQQLNNPVDVGDEQQVCCNQNCGDSLETGSNRVISVGC